METTTDFPAPDGWEDISDYAGGDTSPVWWSNDLQRHVSIETGPSALDANGDPYWWVAVADADGDEVADDIFLADPENVDAVITFVEQA